MGDEQKKNRVEYTDAADISEEWTELEQSIREVVLGNETIDGKRPVGYAFVIMLEDDEGYATASAYGDLRADPDVEYELAEKMLKGDAEGMKEALDHALRLAIEDELECLSEERGA